MDSVDKALVSKRAAPLRQVEIHKFGGSSLATSAAVESVYEIIINQTRSQDLVVVSANGNVTDLLIELASGQANALGRLHGFFKALTQQLGIAELFATIDAELKAIATLASKQENYHRVLAFGEVWSARILATYLKSKGVLAQAIDARDLLICRGGNPRGNGAGHEVFSEQLADKLTALAKANSGTRLIITGFIASSTSGETITLGRNGSDLSASLIAAAIRAKRITLWTDVAGVFTADPQLVSSSKPLPQLTFAEAEAIAQYGTQVFHPSTIRPIGTEQIPIQIRSTQEPDESGTRVNNKYSAKGSPKSLSCRSSLKKLSLLNISTDECREVIAALEYDNLRLHKVEIGAAYQQLDLYLAPGDLSAACQRICSFQHYPVVSETDYTQVCLIGRGINSQRSIIDSFLQTFDSYSCDYQFNCDANALAVTVASELPTGLLQRLHDEFFESKQATPLVLLGTGNIGTGFLQIFKANQARVEKLIGRSLALVAVANSRQYIFQPQGINLEQWSEGSADEISSQDWQENTNNQSLDVLVSYRGRELVILDLTASQEIANHYQAFAESGWHIVSANKLVASCPEMAPNIDALTRRNARKWLRNTTAGAGLPVQSALTDLVNSGDRVLEISGIFSGSLSWLFGHYDGTEPFSELVDRAVKLGLTEPDPLIDLSGDDVSRKARILAELVGFQSARENYRSVGTADELDAIRNQQDWTDLDDHIHSLFLAARARNEVLRFVATLTRKSLSTGLVSVSASDCLATLTPCDNFFRIRTQRYLDNPLIIQGPGAGQAVTSAGVVSDLIQLFRAV